MKKIKLFVGIPFLILIISLSIFLVFKITNINNGKSDIVPPFSGITFSTIAKENYSGHTEKKNYVISNTGDWEKLWNIVYTTTDPKPILPKVDFKKETVMAVFRGQSGGGDSISISRIGGDHEIVVIIDNIKSGLSCTTIASLTQPFQIIKTKKIDKEIKFIEEEKIIECK